MEEIPIHQNFNNFNTSIHDVSIIMIHWKFQYVGNINVSEIIKD